MLNKIIFIGLVLICTIFAQTTDLESEVKKKSDEIPQGINYGGLVTANFSQTALQNWASGGNNSVAVNGLLNLFLNYRKGKGIWRNTADFGYGLLRQGEDGNVIKTDDRIEINSKYGLNATNNWYYSGMLNFVTQMAKGYKYEGDSVKISAPFAPAYLTTALGMDYQKGDVFDIFLSPVTGKLTLVIDDDLSSQGAFGVEKNSNSRLEFGGYIKTGYRKELIENVTLTTNLSFFSNYLDNPQNIDIDWKTLVAMQVNKYISANISVHMIYDDDIVTFDETGKKEGPDVQLKEIIGIGLSYSFK